MKRSISLIILLSLVGMGTIWTITPNRPHTLGVSIRSHVVSPSVMRATLNERNIVFKSVRGRNETGGADYPNRWSDALDFKLSWYDILEDQAYSSDFSVAARELSTFSDLGEVADIRITIGPGADIMAITPDPEEMRLIGLRLQDELRALGHPPPIILRALCAAPLHADDPIAMELATFYKNYVEPADGSGHPQLQRKLDSRERHIQKNGSTMPRCRIEGEN